MADFPGGDGVVSPEVYRKSEFSDQTDRESAVHDHPQLRL